MLTHKLNTKTYMSVKDIGELLGISKAAVEKIAYTKNCFNTERLCGKRWVELESFEKWYANQTRYKKITGAEPGDALREWSYSVHELAQHLFVRDTTIYYLIRKYQLKTVTIDGRIRILKDSFQEWYEKQNRYRMAADREKPACLEENTFSISQIALLLGISRYRVECIAKSPDYSGFFEFVQTGKGRRITAKSFKAFLEGQDKYHLCSDSPFEIKCSALHFRHTSITYKLKLNGGDIKAVQGDSGHARVGMVADVYSHIIDENRRHNAELFEEAFYGKKDISSTPADGTLTGEKSCSISGAVSLPEGIDPSILTKVLSNPEMLALISALAKNMQE